MNKWEAAGKYAKKRNWAFEIWTEETLDAMGIMPKKGFKRLPAPPKGKAPLKRLKSAPRPKKTFKPYKAFSK